MPQRLSPQPVCGDALTPAEQRVMAIFRQYLMTPGRMLCFCGPDLDVWNPTLAEMSRKGFLVAERFRGGFSLTRLGFAFMRRA